jgi:hypothetical protein
MVPIDEEARAAPNSGASFFNCLQALGGLLPAEVRRKCSKEGQVCPVPNNYGTEPSNEIFKDLVN